MDTTYLKQRGQNHHKNKARYKNKAKVVTKPTSLDEELHESNSGIKNNWDRYEEPNESEVTDDSTNFSILAQAPLSHSGYFQFKSQKDVQSQCDLDQFQSNNMFSLNLNLLSLCLETIPFNNRCNIDENFLEKADVHEFENKARECLRQYEKIYMPLSTNSESLQVAEITSPEENLLKEIDDQFNLDANSETVLSKAVQGTGKNDDDLEQWLDDFLDD